MNRFIRILLVATMMIGVADLAVAEQVVAKSPVKTAPAPKAHASSGCTGTTTYLHVDCATEIAFGWVQFDCCPSIFGRQSYYRWADNHVNIVVRAYRNFQSMCRGVAVHGSDWSKYAVYADNSPYWYVCGV